MEPIIDDHVDERVRYDVASIESDYFFFFKQKTAYEIGLGIPAEPLFRSLDINNTIDNRPEGDEKWFLENEKTVTQFCRKLAAERPLKDIRDEYNYPKKKGIKDECSRSEERRVGKECRSGWAPDRREKDVG